MKLGLMLGYSGATVDFPIDLVKLAEKLGYDSVWTSEAYGSDAMTPLAWIAAQTSRIRLGTSIAQLAGRPPAMCAMQAMTIDGLAGGGRMILGLGVSGPQIVEGWYGQPWGKPYWRVRDYIEILRKILRREGPVSHDGREISLPYDGEGATGLGKPLRSIIRPAHDIPIYLGSGSESMLRLCGELCDGALPLRFVPRQMPRFKRPIEEGFRRAGNGKSWDSFSFEAVVSVIVTEDVKAALRTMKPGIALYVGGMGHPAANFHKRAMEQLGYAEAAARIEELFRAGRKQEAADAVPDEFVDEQALVGSPDRIRQGYRAWAECGVTALHIDTSQAAAIELLADIADTAESAA
ncbi:MAG TPA: LLM class F420-dependent oxidoreductase [Trebonia sp.]|nr:LLM class F420-dependent oxidoreductase [Trebonia sp.]